MAFSPFFFHLSALIIGFLLKILAGHAWMVYHHLLYVDVSCLCVVAVIRQPGADMTGAGSGECCRSSTSAMRYKMLESYRILKSVCLCI